MTYRIPGQIAYDYREPYYFNEPEEIDMEQEIPLSCRRMGELDAHAGEIHINPVMTDRQMRDAVITLMQCMPDDKRAALIEELSEVS